MEQPVTYRPKQAATSKRIKGQSGTPASPGIPFGTEVVLATVDLLKGVFPVLESLYYDGDAPGTGYLRFRVTVDGYPLSHDWADSYNPLGAAGEPAQIGEGMPPGRKLEIRCKNEHPSDSTLSAWCDGEVFYSEKPLD